MIDGRYSPRNRAILDAHTKGETFASIAEQHGVTSPRIQQIVKREKFHEKLHKKWCIDVTQIAVVHICSHPRGEFFLRHYDGFADQLERASNELVLRTQKTTQDVPSER